MNKMKNRKWKVVPFQKKDLPAIGQFFKKNFRSASQYGSMGTFQWRAVDNYIMPGIINLIKDGDKIVSTLSNTPKKLLVKGKGYLVAEIGDANTDPHYQRQGMLSLLINQSTRDALDKGIKGVYSTPDTKTPSLPAFIKKANYLPQKDLNIQSLVFPIDIGPLIKKRVHWLIRHYIGSFFLTLVYIFFLLKKGLSFWGSTYNVYELTELPDDWDNFWEKAKKSFDYIFERNKKALTWRFFRNPNKYKFNIAQTEDAVIGYLVYRIINDEDVKRLIIADYLFLPGYESQFQLLMLKVIEDAFQIGVNYISSWCMKGTDYYKYFKKFGFIKRNRILLIWFQNEFISKLEDGKTWHFTISDSDNV